MTRTRRLRLVPLVFLLGALAASGGEPPYPPSTVITGIDWDASASQQAEGSDAWPVTWADDGHLYLSYSDGRGFDPQIPIKLSTGYARVEGQPPGHSGINIRSDGEETGDGGAGKKGSGMVSIQGRLYMMVRNADRNSRQCQLAWSDDHAASWTWASWSFEELGYCAFLNFGRDYGGARDSYLYLYSPDTSHAYIETDSVVLARVPTDRVTEESAWEFYSGTSGGQPQWSPSIAGRASVFDFQGGCNRLDVTYNPALGRYLMTMRARARDGGGNPNHFSIYDAPEPWGPWTTVYYTESSLPGMSAMNSSSGGWGESQHIPAKWIAGDGRSFTLIYAGDDSFRTRRATLTVGGSPGVCGNGVRESGEQCDGSDLGGATCSSLGYESGTLDCSPGCEYDASSCAGPAAPDPPDNLRRTDTPG